MNISGDQGIDQTINYVVKTEIPRSDLGNQSIHLLIIFRLRLLHLELAIKPSEILKVNVNVSGTFLKPVVTPFFGNNPPDSTVRTSGKQPGRQ